MIESIRDKDIRLELAAERAGVKGEKLKILLEEAWCQQDTETEMTE